MQPLVDIFAYLDLAFSSPAMRRELPMRNSRPRNARWLRHWQATIATMFWHMVQQPWMQAPV